MRYINIKKFGPHLDFTASTVVTHQHNDHKNAWGNGMKNLKSASNRHDLCAYSHTIQVWFHPRSSGVQSAQFANRVVARQSLCMFQVIAKTHPNVENMDIGLSLLEKYSLVQLMKTNLSKQLKNGKNMWGFPVEISEKKKKLLKFSLLLMTDFIAIFLFFQPLRFAQKDPNDAPNLKCILDFLLAELE